MTTKKEKSDETLSLHERLFKMMEQLDFIAKDKTNTFHKYNYASEYAIKEAVHAQLVKNRVLFNLSFLELLPSANSGLVHAVFEYSFTNVDNPTDKITGRFVGSGEDKGDKAIYKATTGAIKYALTSTFLIPTGDDAEAVSEKPKSEARWTSRQTEQKSKPELSDSELKEYVRRIENSDGEDNGVGLYHKVLNYYKTTKEQEVKMSNAILTLNGKLKLKESVKDGNN
jgi:hypothetical protein